MVIPKNLQTFNLETLELSYNLDLNLIKSQNLLSQVCEQLVVNGYLEFFKIDIQFLSNYVWISCLSFNSQDFFVPNEIKKGKKCYYGIYYYMI